MSIFDGIENEKVYTRTPSLVGGTEENPNRYRLRIDKMEQGLTPQSEMPFFRATFTVVSAKDGGSTPSGRPVNAVGTQAEFYVMKSAKFPKAHLPEIARFASGLLAKPGLTLSKGLLEDLCGSTAIIGQEVDVSLFHKADDDGSLKYFGGDEDKPINKYTWKPVVAPSITAMAKPAVTTTAAKTK
jgi:hypothetical protein